MGGTSYKNSLEMSTKELADHLQDSLLKILLCSRMLVIRDLLLLLEGRWGEDEVVVVEVSPMRGARSEPGVGVEADK